MCKYIYLGFSPTPVRRENPRQLKALIEQEDVSIYWLFCFAVRLLLCSGRIGFLLDRRVQKTREHVWLIINAL